MNPYIKRIRPKGPMAIKTSVPEAVGRKVDRMLLEHQAERRKKVR
jgi:hypothetical protein